MGIHKKKKKKGERRKRWGSAVPYTPGHIHWITDGRFCAFWSADLQSILDVRICSSALSAREYQCSGCGRSDGLGREHLGNGGTGNSGPRRAFAHQMGFLFFFFLFLLLHLHLLFLLPITLPFLTHLVLKTHHVLRFTPSLEVDQLVPLRGKGDRDQPGSKRYPASNTTNDAGIGQKRKHPHTAAAVAAAPVTRSACGLGSAHVAYGAAPGALEKARPSPVFGNHEPRHQPTNQPISSIM